MRRVNRYVHSRRTVFRDRSGIRAPKVQPDRGKQTDKQGATGSFYYNVHLALFLLPCLYLSVAARFENKKPGKKKTTTRLSGMPTARLPSHRIPPMSGTFTYFHYCSFLLFLIYYFFFLLEAHNPFRAAYSDER